MIAKLLALNALILFVTVADVYSQDPVRFDENLILMGCRFDISGIADTRTNAELAVNKGIAEIKRVEALISSWDPNSQTSAINTNAGVIPVTVDLELYELIHRSKKISELTDGAFDISFASMNKVWIFDGGKHALADSHKVADAGRFINWKNILLDPGNQTVFLKNKGMKIGFGAIGKGYAANRAKQIMIECEGLMGGVVNASGDLIAWGESTTPDGFTIQISDPDNPDKAIAWLQINNTAVVTSGNYEKYFINNGTRYAHILNPKTGYPCTGIKSVSVICDDAEFADALATSIFVLGTDAGLKLAEGIAGVRCIIIDDKNRIHHSANLELNYY